MPNISTVVPIGGGRRLAMCPIALMLARNFLRGIHERVLQRCPPVSYDTKTAGISIPCEFSSVPRMITLQFFLGLLSATTTAEAPASCACITWFGRGCG